MSLARTSRFFYGKSFLGRYGGTSACHTSVGLGAGGSRAVRFRRVLSGTRLLLLAASVVAYLGLAAPVASAAPEPFYGEFIQNNTDAL